MLRPLLAGISFVVLVLGTLRADEPVPKVPTPADKTSGKQWFVAPLGRPMNAGTIDSPWDIGTGLSNVTRIRPGDTVFLRGGTYRYKSRAPGIKGFSILLKGTREAPIRVQPYQNERVTIDGGIQSFDADPGHDFVIMGLEVLVSENQTQPRKSSQRGSDAPKDLRRPWGGIDIRSGNNIQLVNNFVHDNMQGIGMWGSVGGDSKIYGNIIFRNGWDAPDRKHGHGIYAQNATPDWKYVVDNILFDNFSLNMQAYGSDAARVDRFYVAGNIYSKGSSSDHGGVLIGGGHPSQTIRVVNNFGRGSFYIGYVDGGNDLVATDNRIWEDFAWKRSFTKVTARGNFAWQNDWKAPRLDNEEIAVPAEPYVFQQRNACDERRAHLAVMNFRGRPEFKWEPKKFLKVGESYQISNPEGLFDKPLLEGTYDGKAITLPLRQEFAIYIAVKSAPETAKAK